MKLRHRRRPEVMRETDPWNRVRAGLGTLVVVMVVGIVGYRLLGLTLFEALYQTAITVTTVGFAEIGPPDRIDTGYRLFTLMLVFFGVGGALYTLGTMVEAFVEGSLNDGFRLRKDQRMIDKMSGHTVIVGAGRVGQSISRYLQRHDASQVIINLEQRVDIAHPIVVGDATDDRVLLQAGIDRAAVLIAALNTDAGNVYVTLSARALNPNLFIVARTNDQSSEPKFHQAGADRVVNPYEIGGSRMAALAMHPTLAEFLDEVLHDDAHNVRIAEIALPASSPMIGETIATVTTSVSSPPLLIAVRSADYGYRTNPEPSTVLEQGDVLIALGDAKQVRELRAHCC